MRKILIVLSEWGFWGEELIGPLEVFDDKGYEQFQVYDPISKILYSGDLGSSLGTQYRVVPDFDAHIPFMQGFHERYMGSSAAMKAWAKMVRQLDIETIAPQHGAMFSGKALVERFIDWCDGLKCGIDLFADMYKIPV